VCKKTTKRQPREQLNAHIRIVHRRKKQARTVAHKATTKRRSEQEMGNTELLSRQGASEKRAALRRNQYPLNAVAVSRPSSFRSRHCTCVVLEALYVEMMMLQQESPPNGPTSMVTFTLAPPRCDWRWGRGYLHLEKRSPPRCTWHLQMYSVHSKLRIHPPQRTNNRNGDKIGSDSSRTYPPHDSSDLPPVICAHVNAESA
jgi:hypothetical protein